mmetsp:Transcript_4474/g.6703  ORF Transcript_4474/g.6703 Transcript_4474/m.6703 type:complete len:112 (+) Transcript_4474:359-694(+)
MMPEYFKSCRMILAASGPFIRNMTLSMRMKSKPRPLLTTAGPRDAAWTPGCESPSFDSSFVDYWVHGNIEHSLTHWTHHNVIVKVFQVHATTRKLSGLAPSGLCATPGEML